MKFKHTLAAASLALALPFSAHAGMPGMEGAHHVGLTVPNMDDAVRAA
jgi:hypothetical protein